MRVALLCLFAVGCASGVDTAGDTPDAALPEPDATATTPAATGCDVTLADTAGIKRAHLGGTGGGKGPILACDDTAGERITGAVVRTSDQATIFGGRSAHGIAIICSHVSLDPSGTPTVTGAKQIEISGTGTSGWSPSTWSTVTQCKPGWVVSGMTAKTGADNNRFLDVSIICTKLGADAVATTTSETIRIVGSQTDTSIVKTARCGTGEVLAQLGTFTGAGIDAVDLSCSRPACR